jgi:selenocysteine lyase/cysteine desulfurase
MPVAITEASRAVTAVPGPADVRPLLPVIGADLHVPLVTGGSSRYVQLDYAASAPALTSVAEQVSRALPYYASVHRGAGYSSQVSTALYEATRPVVAAFVGARADDVVVVTRNTTDALNLLASAVPAGGEVVFLDVEHHANLLPWMRRPGNRVLNAGDTLAETLQRLDAELLARPAALVTVTGASNVTGEVLLVREIVRIARRHGARVALDGAQLVPHRPVDLAGWDVDYLAFSGHKLYAPYGAGVLVGRRDWLDAAPAHLAGGGAVRRVGTDGARWADAPQRHEGGTPNVLGAVALAEACRSLSALPAGALQRHENALLDQLTAGLAGVPGVRVLRIWPDSADTVGVVGFTVAGHDPGLVAAYLSAEHGIGVRDGQFCAHPLLARLGQSGGALRASVGVGSSSQDVQRLLRALDRLVHAGRAWTYGQDRGRWVPQPDPRPWPTDLGPLDLGSAPASPCLER